MQYTNAAFATQAQQGVPNVPDMAQDVLPADAEQEDDAQTDSTNYWISNIEGGSGYAHGFGARRLQTDGYDVVAHQ